jgi:hypothetical protein
MQAVDAITIHIRLQGTYPPLIAAISLLELELEPEPVSEPGRKPTK